MVKILKFPGYLELHYIGAMQYWGLPASIIFKTQLLNQITQTQCGSLLPNCLTINKYGIVKGEGKELHIMALIILLIHNAFKSSWFVNVVYGSTREGNSKLWTKTGQQQRGH